MSLRIIFGKAGSGKSKFCIDDIKKAWVIDTSRTLILIVPEQFSFQAERSMVKALGGLGLGKPEVLSFKRLARKVMDEVGGSAKQHVNNAGKAMIIHSVLNKYRDNFKAFGRSAGQKGFVDKLSGMLSEFKRYNIDSIVLEETTEKIEDKFLKDKLEDLTLIYSKYEEILHQRYIDTDDDLTLLRDRIDKSKYLKDSEIWIDEFSGFTPQEYEIIAKLLQVTKRINVSLCTDCLMDCEQIQDIDVFYSIKNTGNKLIAIARDANIEIEKPIALKSDIPWRFNNSKALAHMEENLFKYPYEIYDKNTDDIKVISAANLYNEVENTAEYIVKFCRGKKIRYKNMAVVMRNLDDYEKLIRIIFPQYNIPFFIDKKRAVTEHPLTLLVLSALQILIKNFSYESVFRYLKTGLLFKTQNSVLIPQDVDMLENYVLANGIRGGKWFQKEPWDYRIEYSIEANEPGKEELEMINKINDIRLAVIEPIIVFKEKIKSSKKARDLCQYLYEFLCNIEIPEKIEELEAKYKEKNELEIAEEYKQIWDMIIDILDQIVEVNGDEKLKLEEFYDTLDLGFSEHSMGLIPHAIDEVLIGSIDRWRSHEIDILFILGANDGILPAVSKDEGMLSDKDRNALRELGLELAPDTKTQAFDEQFLLYSALTKAGGSLIISYPLGDSEGKGLRPSTIISKLKRIFPKMERLSTVIDAGKGLNNVTATIPTFNMLISTLRNLAEDQSIDSDLWRNVYLWFMERPEWKYRLSHIAEGLFYTNEENSLGEGKFIIGNRHYTSVSRLERYKSCPFSYYVQYGLRAKERRIMSMEPPDIGSFLHLVIDLFSKYLQKESIKWADVEESWSNKKIDQLVEEIVGSSPGLPLKRTNRYMYLKERLKRVVKRSIWLIVEQAKRSNFEPIIYEGQFGGEGLPAMKLILPDGGEIVLTGRIDRIDLYKENDKSYVRIVDYKSGSKSFRLSDLYYGLQLQLILYLSTIWEKGIGGIADKVLPAGFFYFKLDEPLIRTKGKNEDMDIEKEIMKEMKMKGLILADADIIKQMDKSIEGHSLILPARINKDGTLGKSSSVATIKQFEMLKSYAKNILYDISKEIYKGNISISPYKKNKSTPCSYCPYSSICRFEPNIAGNKYRFLKELNNEKAWELLQKEAEGQGGEAID